jgi:putative methylase
MRRSELIRKLATLEPFPDPDASREQVATPPERAADLLFEAVGRDDLVGRSVVDLGCGTGTLAIGAALLGASTVYGLDGDAAAVEIARRAAGRLAPGARLEVGRVTGQALPAETVVMNPPFGAQRAGAEEPFWESALASARRAIYAYALPVSRSFIAERAVARGVRIELTRPVPWELVRTFPHHRKRRVELPVDLWVLRRDTPP